MPQTQVIVVDREDLVFGAVDKQEPRAPRTIEDAGA
jgi:hypothetical protein